MKEHEIKQNTMNDIQFILTELNHQMYIHQIPPIKNDPGMNVEGMNRKQIIQYTCRAIERIKGRIPLAPNTVTVQLLAKAIERLEQQITIIQQPPASPEQQPVIVHMHSAVGKLVSCAASVIPQKTQAQKDAEAPAAKKLALELCDSALTALLEKLTTLSPFMKDKLIKMHAQLSNGHNTEIFFNRVIACGPDMNGLNCIVQEHYQPLVQSVENAKMMDEFFSEADTWATDLLSLPEASISKDRAEQLRQALQEHFYNLSVTLKSTSPNLSASEMSDVLIVKYQQAFVEAVQLIVPAEQAMEKFFLETDNTLTHIASFISKERDEQIRQTVQHDFYAKYLKVWPIDPVQSEAKGLGTEYTAAYIEAVSRIQNIEPKMEMFFKETEDNFEGSSIAGKARQLQKEMHHDFYANYLKSEHGNPISNQALRDLQDKYGTDYAEAVIRIAIAEEEAQHRRRFGR